ncbi:MAG: ATP-binding cassette domain-containing protein [Synechococcales cyanobacterium C42_A2020_086]|jgi:putative ABC transport system ATP-binding protein|nr:ATP-binding cassette domain-containing protein [Synechococcales cyanobacterium C42_A2020_086]
MVSSDLNFGSAPSAPTAHSGIIAYPHLEAAIVARGVSMVFSSRTVSFQALSEINLEVRPGHLHLLMGPAGAGKTTLLLILAGLLTPTAGRVYLLGQDMMALSQSQRAQFRLAHLGIVFQDHNLLRSLTALENVKLLLTLKGVPEQEAEKQALALLEALGLGAQAHTRPRLLSVGQQQRVAVARALAGNPPLIMADEPTSALDSENGRIVAELLHQRSRQGSTVLMATHDARILSFADDVTYLEDGVIVPSGMS